MRLHKEVANSSQSLTQKRVPRDLMSYISFNNRVLERHDKLIWSKFYNQCKEVILKKYHNLVHQDYIKGLSSLNFKEFEIPSLEYINEKLEKIEWVAVHVDNFIHPRVYAMLLSNSIFPISGHIRKPEHISYSPSPDFIHDVFGHLPTLFNEKFRNFIKSWAKCAARASVSQEDNLALELTLKLIKEKERDLKDLNIIKNLTKELLDVHKASIKNPSELKKLSRMYAWSIEFGIIGNKDEFRVIGAAALTSSEELKLLHDRKTKLKNFDKTTLYKDVNFTNLQPQAFVAKSIRDFYKVLNLV